MPNSQFPHPDQIENINPDKLKEYEQATGIALVQAHMDFSSFQRANVEAEERRLMPRYVEKHFLNASLEMNNDRRLIEDYLPIQMFARSLRF